jgi:membrane protease YdiL (CAAX protease family)
LTPWGWFGYLFLYPLLEEIIFRAGLLRWADGHWPQWRGWRTNLGVSILFGAAHLWSWPWTHAVAVVIPSLALGWLMQRFGRLSICVVTHSVFNAMRYFAVAYLS